MKEAVRWEVKVEGNERSIQLFDENNKPIAGKNAYWEGDFYCSYNKLTSLKGAPEVVGGYFNCYNNQLISLEGAPKAVGGVFYCDNNLLTSLEGAPEVVGGYFYCYNNKLTSLEGAPKVVGRNFYCNNNQLISLEGAPKAVGGVFYCYNNQLTSLKGKPIEKSKEVPMLLHKAFLKEGFVYADGILKKLVFKKKKGNLIIFKVKELGKEDISYIVKKNDNYSHGKTLKQAIKDLRYKISNRDVSDYEHWKLNTTVTLDEAIQGYRVITGACELGTREFVNSLRKVPKKLKVKDMIKLTKGQYGNDTLVKFMEGR